MEGRSMNTGRRDPFAAPRNTAELLRMERTIDSLHEMISSAQRVPMMRGGCLVNREQTLDLLDSLKEMLPQAIKQANALLADEENIRAKAAKEAESVTQKASEAASKTMADSKKNAEEAATAQANAKNAAAALKAQAESDAKAIRDKAVVEAQAMQARVERECNDLVARARMEAGMILRDAEQKANAAVSEQNVYNMAVMAAKELQEETEQQMASLRHHYISGLSNLMGSADDYLMRLVETIRQERANLINQG